ncbi:hypothetical protein ACFQYP_32310 [Nonomuraea antimicrobica]
MDAGTAPVTPSASSTGTAPSTGAAPSTETSPSTGTSPSTRTSPSSGTSPSTAASPKDGEKIREGEASLRDQDYLDVESGRTGTIDPATSDLWYVSPYRSLWTAGGGEYPITPVDARPGPDDCAQALTAREYDQVEVGKLAPGDWACARTAEGNLVGIRFPAIPTGDAPLKISYTVWHWTPQE